MRGKNKREIAIRAESGLPVHPPDVARVARSGTRITIRHSWYHVRDARVINGVSRAVWALAHATADRFGREVDVYGHDGALLDRVRPS